MTKTIVAMLTAGLFCCAALAAEPTTATSTNTKAVSKKPIANQPAKCQWIPLEQALRGAGADNAAIAQIQPVYDGLVASGSNEAAISSALTEQFVTYIVPILANCAGATAAGPGAGATSAATPPAPPAGGTGGGGGCDPRVASCN